jgi:hypothetical protein
MNEAQLNEVKPAPFDTARLDALLEEDGIDVLVATSKHNVHICLAAIVSSSSTTWMRSE